MNSEYIAILDSGIGGLSLLKELDKNFSGQKFIYFGDNLNAPYGSKSKQELLDLTIYNINNILKYNIKTIILACNTLSVNILSEIESRFKIKCFGVFPPIKKESEKGKTVLICTPQTASQFCDNKNLEVIPFRDLAIDIENNFFSQNKINLFDHFRLAFLEKYGKPIGSIDKIHSFFKDKRLILGCTHYDLIKNKIFNHFQPHTITSGVSNTIDTLFKYIKNCKITSKNKIIFSGDCKKYNKIVFKNLK